MTTNLEQTYAIEGRDLVLNVDGLRVQVLTLGPGEAVPWHYHTEITDIFVAIEGRVLIETLAPARRHDLTPGRHCVVQAGTAHTVYSASGERCRFTIIQGVGVYDYVPIDPPG